MKYLTLFIFICFASTKGYTQQSTPAKYWVTFTDKNNSPYSVFKPYEFLTARSLERRAREGIAIEENDLPVNPDYVEKVLKTGAKIHNRSRWMNAATVVADSLTATKIAKLPFVMSVKYVGKHLTGKSGPAPGIRQKELPPYEPVPEYYGYGAAQISLLNGHLLHQLGYRGAGKMIGVLDGGFSNVDIMPFFDSLRAEGRLIAGYDFSDNDTTVFESSGHGTQVLSTMASTLPGLLVGTAPDATYLLIKTEDTRGEYLVEECNWVAGAEYADSMGVDVINSSLGYTTFTDTSMNYSYRDMDGTSLASRAADIAFSKGMLVVNSAGNSGNDPWKYIGVPADAHNVLSVGATTARGEIANFSSRGPTADGRVKPNVSATGQSVVVASRTGYDLQLSNGTSLASPIMAGMVASLWSAFPYKTNAEIFDAIEESGHLFQNFNDDYGYGIPDFVNAYLLLKADHGNRQLNTWLVEDEEFQTLELLNYTEVPGEMTIELQTLAGRFLTDKKVSLQPDRLQRIPLSDFEKLDTGLYTIVVRVGEQELYFLMGR